MKQNQLLAKTEASASQYKNLITGFVKTFKDNPTVFTGKKKTYSPKEGFPVNPNYDSHEKVQSTVTKHLEWFEDMAATHIDNLLSIEATNASGDVIADLIIEDINFGSMSSHELMRLRTLFVNGDLDKMYATLPARSEKTNWKKTADLEYANMEIFEAPMVKDEDRTSEVEAFIIPDPNIEKIIDRLKSMNGYIPAQGARKTTTIKGNYTIQDFTGETTHQERANILKRKTSILVGIQEALVRCNEAEVTSSQLKAKKLLNFLHYGRKDTNT